MLGVEAADNILFGTPELTLRHPNIVNAKKNEELRFSERSMREKGGEEKEGHEAKETETIAEAVGASRAKEIAGGNAKTIAVDARAA
jgi:hypothetical protein